MMANWRWIAFAVLCIALQCTTPGESRLQKRNDELAADPVQTTVSQLSEQMTAMKSQMTAQGDKIAALEVKLNGLKRTVAFHAVSVDHVNARGHSPLVLPIAQTNEGNAYDVSTGFFTAPVSGMYIFRANFMCADLTTYVHADIYVNGVYVAGSMSDCRRGYLDSVSTEVIARVQTGQKVNLGNPDDSTSAYYGHKYTTFSGFLLQAD